MYEIFTDTAANLDCSLLEELGVELIPFSFYYNGEEHRVTSLEQFDGHAYYDMIRAGTDVTTSLVEPQRYIDGFTPLLREGRDILFVGMSSGISGSYASAEWLPPHCGRNSRNGKYGWWIRYPPRWRRACRY